MKNLHKIKDNSIYDLINRDGAERFWSNLWAIIKDMPNYNLRINRELFGYDLGKNISTWEVLSPFEYRGRYDGSNWDRWYYEPERLNSWKAAGSPQGDDLLDKIEII